MQQTNKSAPKTKVILTWLAVLTFMAGTYLFCAWWFGRRTPVQVGESAPTIVYSITMIFVGVFFLVAGGAAYAATIFTNCLTFNFSRPVWSELKVKQYFANIFVPLGAALGLGFILAAFLSPLLIAKGVERGIANISPVMGMVFILQIVQLWFLIWGPLEKRIITKRMQALGVTPAQLQNAFLVGLSNPAKSSFKKFGQVEEDIGALWAGPEQLIYWGDGEQLAVTREQLVQIERRADAGSTSMLGGITHIILHVRQPDGSERQIRLHTEGLLTMGQKKKAMDQLAEAIVLWHCNTVSAARV